MRMRDRFHGYQYRIVDVSRIDAEPLLASDRLEDNVIAVLFRLTDQRAALRRILMRIAQAEPGRRAEAAKGLFVLAGLRRLRPMLKEEERKARTVDITYDWFTDPTIGPVIAEAAEEAAAKAGAQARAEALIAEQRILRRQTEKRFGPLPEAVVARIAAMSLTELEDFSLRVLDAASLDEMFS